ncbi:sulfatase-like hydrolase/transferase [Aromatoleum bremense]|uniref:Sulfatase-like hydrolase/transferase n=1 Tax=Aromatoleum bremense TaxID=76115 RepID=A0ABX1NWJ9_9RHOO|nr:sulfatase-like hydrolase/transferase [Aromatoleum bremense]NMG16399.1 sulfatase-like hydrolase/transferase [Aromatoleum bremense]QTQ31270.1 Putative sulfatase [Aromatoleum bremense]
MRKSRSRRANASLSHFRSRTFARGSHALQENGYRTVFAIDERRFANIDESFGFDQIVGPKAGALDFLLQRMNDTPLTNLLLQTRLAQWVLPFSYLNTASHANYNSRGFVEEAVAGSTETKPLFLAVHFESAHFPFKTRHAARKIDYSNDFMARHVAALTGVDAQVGHLVSLLAARGRLENALVIVLSDHGEGLGEIEAQTTRVGEPYLVRGFGHGGSVLSEHQNRVVLGLIRFQGGQPVDAPGLHRNDLVSLTDVRDVIERFASRGEIHLEPKTNRCILSETGLRFRAAADYKTLNPAELAAESANHYEIDDAGRMRLREDRLALLVAAKDVALRCTNKLTYFSNVENRHFAYSIDASRRLTEIEPEKTDVARIEAYRQKLADTAHPY